MNEPLDITVNKIRAHIKLSPLETVISRMECESRRKPQLWALPSRESKGLVCGPRFRKPQQVSVVNKFETGRIKFYKTIILSFARVYKESIPLYIWGTNSTCSAFQLGKSRVQVSMPCITQ